jgi:hypothetical protein
MTTRRASRIARSPRGVLRECQRSGENEMKSKLINRLYPPPIPKRLGATCFGRSWDEANEGCQSCRPDVMARCRWGCMTVRAEMGKGKEVMPDGSVVETRRGGF